MKKYVSLFLAILAIFMLAGCNNGIPAPAPNQNMNSFGGIEGTYTLTSATGNGININQNGLKQMGLSAFSITLNPGGSGVANVYASGSNKQENITWFQNGNSITMTASSGQPLIGTVQGNTLVFMNQGIAMTLTKTGDSAVPYYPTTTYNPIPTYHPTSTYYPNYNTPSYNSTPSNYYSY